MEVEEVPVPLPSAATIQISPNVRIQPPLTRRGKGPGLVIFVPNELDLVEGSHSLDPPPLQKWGEEGYAVLEFKIDIANKNLVFSPEDDQDFAKGMTAIYDLSERTGEKLGCIG